MEDSLAVGSLATTASEAGITPDSAPANDRVAVPPPSSQPSVCPAFDYSELEKNPSEESYQDHNVESASIMASMGKSRPAVSSKTKGKNPSGRVVVVDSSISSLISATRASHHQKRTPHKAGKKGGRRRLTPKPRQSHYSEKEHCQTGFSVEDDEPNRIVNPLCDIPRLESQSHHEPPNAAELHTWADLVFGKPNTFPLSFYARLLGFRVDPVPKDKYVALDPATIPLLHDIPSIPKPGILPQIWKNDVRTFVDPMDPVYASLLSETTQSLNSVNKAAISMNGNRSLSKSCLDLARDLLEIDASQFRTDDQGTEFGVACGRSSIRYEFMWYQLSKDGKPEPKNATKIVGPYGVTSLATRIQKPAVSELIMQIKSIDRSRRLHSPAEMKSAPRTPNSWSSHSLRAEPIMSYDKSSSRPDQSSDGPIQPSNPSIPNGENKIPPVHPSAIADHDNELVVLVALCLEHARECGIVYSFVQIRDSFVASHLLKYFRMVHLPDDETRATLLCDLNMCSSKYAFLLCKECTDVPEVKQESLQNEDTIVSLRMLVRQPLASVVKKILDGGATSVHKSRRNPPSNASSAPEALRSIAFSVRIDASSVKLILQDSTSIVNEIDIADDESIPDWNIIRIFDRPDSRHQKRNGDDEILYSLEQKRDQLVSLESQMEPKLRSLLAAVVRERLQFEKDVVQRNKDDRTLMEYQAVLDRRIELDLLRQKQRDQDMDAVCEICSDGDVTPDNQILFCEACNVAIHQYCYGIEKVPEGDYYCLACRYFGRKKTDLTALGQVEDGAPLVFGPSPLPIKCELCPRKQGAFIRTDSSTHMVDPDGGKVSKWVHVLCAKWQGLNFIDERKDCVEDVLALKQNFRLLNIRCQLCRGDRGAFNKCRVPDCKHWMHITCARSYGHCEVVHGENCYGEVLLNPWTLLCHEHSDVTPPTESVSLTELALLANEFPPEPEVEKVKSKPITKAFGKMSGKERREFLSVPENEKAFVEELLTKKLHGVRCEVCFTIEEEGKNVTKCVSCGVVFCDSCKLPFDDEDIQAKQFRCQACTVVEEAKLLHEKVEKPSCVLCFQPGGWLRMARGIPMKKWPLNRQKEYEKTLFEKRLWVHALCAMWQHPLLVTDMERREVNLSDAIMTHGKGFILGLNRCELCGHKDGLKSKCSQPNCRQRGQRSRPSHVHVTCARQAGFEVDTGVEGEDITFHVKCYRHVSCEYAFRARLEDLIEFEKLRAGKKLDDSKYMSSSHASRLLNSAIVVIKYLGWAWRWAEWWVEYGSNWEPLIEPGQDETKMTKEELKIVDSTPESRCTDARRCRLAALGAALRNRSYDDEEDGPTVMLERALRAVLNTPSLVGPLTGEEIDFFLQWLCIAYRSKSRLLGLGADKIPVDKTAPSSLHEDDKSPKFLLGNRRLPGKKVLPEGTIFETDILEVDDFLKVERLEDGMLYSEFLEQKKSVKQKSFKQRDSSSIDLEGQIAQNGVKQNHVEFDNIGEKIDDQAPKRKRGRPPKDTSIRAPTSNRDEDVQTCHDKDLRGSPLNSKITTSRHPIVGDASSTIVERRLLATEGNLQVSNHGALGTFEQLSRERQKGEDVKVIEGVLSDIEKPTKKYERAEIVASMTTSRMNQGITSTEHRRNVHQTVFKSGATDGEEKSKEVCSQSSDRTSRPRRVPVVRYNLDDCDEDPDNDADEPPSPSKKRRLSRLGISDSIPLKEKKKDLHHDSNTTTPDYEDPEDANPLSSLRIPRKKAFAKSEGNDLNGPEPEADLSSPLKRGRYRGKLEAAKVVLRRNVSGL